MTLRVAVVGAGPAGLAAAHRLIVSGCEVRLFDPVPPGGLMRTVVRDGWTIEAGAHSVMSTDPGVVAMLGAVADGGMVAPAATRRYVLFHGTPVAVPMSPGELVASPLLTLRGRLRLLKEPFIAPRRDTASESVHAFARRRFGAEVAARLIDPIVGSSTGGDARELLAHVLFPAHVGYEQAGGSVLRGAMRAGMQARRRPPGARTTAVAPAAGMGALATALLGGARHEMVVQHPVTSLTVDDEGATVVTSAGDFACDAIVLATSPTAWRAIDFRGVAQAPLDTIRAMPCASVVSVSLGYRREDVTHALDGASLLVPSSERLSILAAFFASSIFPGRAPEGHVLITVVAGGVNHADLMSAPDNDIARRMHGELVGPLGLTRAPVMQQVTRWVGAMPQPVAGHDHRLAAADELEAGTPRLCLAGGWRAGMSVGEAMASGLRAADRARSVG